MYKTTGRGDSDGIIALIKETADGFGRLLADHIKLARLELVADVKGYGRQVGLIALVVPIVFIGYIVVCLGMAALLAPLLGQAGALFLVGGAHIAIGAVAIRVAINRLQRAQPLSETVEEVSRSMETFSPRIGNGAPSPFPSSSSRG